jgi:hypothetical protein
VGATRAPATAAGLTFDAGALIAIERGDRRLIALLEAALEKRVRLRVPAGVVGRAWRDGRRQVALARFLRAREVQVHALDEHVGRAAGELCGVAGTRDVIDATVVILARATRDTVLTSDPDDLRALDPTVRLERV